MSAAYDLRLAARRGDHTGLTTGRAPGHVQANLVVLPQRHAEDFLAFCNLNAFACPVLGASEAGSPFIPLLGEDLDVRTDLPGYQVHRAGAAPTEVGDIRSEWRDDFVAVALGCWFSMEEALLQAGVRLRHVELGIQGPLFKTQVLTRGKGVFGGPLVVSMRPFEKSSAARVHEITARFARVHGGPVHAGDPAVLGITDISQPDFGEVLLPLPGEIPMYWGCGLTATVALQQSGIDFFITHAPGKMLVTDCLNADLANEPEALFRMSPTFSHLKLSHAGALQLLNAAIEKAQAMQQPQCIAVVDDGCNLLAFVRMDGAKILSEKSAIRKAMTAASSRIPTGGVDEGLAAKLATATGGLTTNLKGGLPIVVDGQVIGGIGVGSGTGDQDREVGNFALAAFAGAQTFKFD